MKLFRSILITSLALIMLVTMTSCALLEGVLSKDKEYEFKELVLTLDSSFAEVELEEEDRTTFVSVSGVGVIVMKETFESMKDDGVPDPESFTTDDYLEAFVESNQYEATVEDLDGLSAFTYLNTTDGEDYKLLVCIYKSNTAFWSVQFMAPADSYDEYEEKFVDWAKHVVFTDNT